MLGLALGLGLGLGFRGRVRVRGRGRGRVRVRGTGRVRVKLRVSRLPGEHAELHERVLATKVEAVRLEERAQRALHPPREHGRREGGAHLVQGQG